MEGYTNHHLCVHEWTTTLSLRLQTFTIYTNFLFEGMGCEGQDIQFFLFLIEKVSLWRYGSFNGLMLQQ